MNSKQVTLKTFARIPSKNFASVNVIHPLLLTGTVESDEDIGDGDEPGPLPVHMLQMVIGQISDHVTMLQMLIGQKNRSRDNAADVDWSNKQTT